MGFINQWLYQWFINHYYATINYTHARRLRLTGDLSAPQRATPATAGQRSSVRLEPLKGGKKGVNLL